MLFPLGYFGMPGPLELLVILVILGIVVGLPLLIVVLLLVIIMRQQSTERGTQVETLEPASREQRSADE